MMVKHSPAYVIGYFRSGPAQTDKAEKLHYAYSRDGLHWYELNQNRPVWTSSLGEGILRDPFINKGQDGKWHLVFTIRPKGKVLGYACSDDLITWTDEKTLEVMASYDQVQNSWAPEFNYDPDQGDYILYWASSVGEDMSHNKHYACRTSDWNSFTETELLFDPGYQTIDASIAQWNGKNYMFFKDESYVYDRTTYPHPPGNKLAVSSQLGGPYEVVSDFITPDFTEGPEILKLQDQEKWYLIYDYWQYGRFGVMESANLVDWSDELHSNQYRFPFKVRHATVFSVAESELRALLDTFSLEAHYPMPFRDYVKLAEYGSGGFMHDEFNMRSVSMWVKADTTNGTQMLYDEGGDKSGLAVQIKEGQLQAAVRNNSVQTTVSASFSGTEEWNHVAAVFNEGKLNLYLNGSLIDTQTAGYCFVESHVHPGGLGARFEVDAFGQSEGSARLNGNLRDVRIYTVPLQDADIQNLYHL
jgi:hypothetical protein